MNIDWKARLKNKSWWVGIVSLVILLLQQLGLPQLADYIPKNYADILNTAFYILAALGVSVDTSTPTLSDGK